MVIKKYVSYIIILFLTACASPEITDAGPAPEPAAPLWFCINGDWAVAGGALVEKRNRAVRWDYHELMNYNTVVSVAQVGGFTETGFTAEIIPAGIGKPRFMVSFAVTSPKQHYYYSFYGFRLAGTAEKITRIELIRSARKDETRSFSEKNNYVITRLASTKTDIPWKGPLDCSVTIKGQTVSLTVNGKKLLTGTVAQQLTGKIGFSVRDARLRLDNIHVVNGKDALIEDDFAKNTLYVPTARIRKVTP
ncbi:MAG TPA: hypothetical protein PK926_08360 [Spirochaetota bacterium]|nr:hypothetical protein [Spirochaetota bacterium]HPI89841.1 hypothetical protein [Spirochaetota bacterium]HPR48646.1 hypothetical protein [Spirochaetota bacterium]